MIEVNQTPWKMADKVFSYEDQMAADSDELKAKTVEFKATLPRW